MNEKLHFPCQIRSGKVTLSLSDPVGESVTFARIYFPITRKDFISS